MYEKLDEESHKWLQCNIEPKKVASVIAIQEQMLETTEWKASGSLPVKSDKCTICKGNSNALVIRMYKTSCNGISEKTK